MIRYDNILLKIKLFIDTLYPLSVRFPKDGATFMINVEKTPEDILREEFLKERAVVLGRSGESVQKALEKLKATETLIEELSECLHALAGQYDRLTRNRSNLAIIRREAIKEINEQIKQYNCTRDYAKLRYYYLIVTREALGLRRHGWVEKTYRIPPPKKYLQE